MPPTTEEKRLSDLLKKTGFIRAKELHEHGFSRTTLLRMLGEGHIIRVARGLYCSTDVQSNENHSLLETAKLVPKGTFCLLSALRFHGLTTQEPYEVWIALPNKHWTPKMNNTALRIIRMSGKSLDHGIQTHVSEGIHMNIYSPAKTVVDCFKFRSTVGMDVAIEALKDCWKKKQATMDEIHQAAQICRMSNVMRPYMEAIA